MCHDGLRPLSFETLLADPLVRLMMAADGVTPQAMVAPLLAVRDAVAARERYAFSAFMASPADGGMAA